MTKCLIDAVTQMRKQLCAPEANTSGKWVSINDSCFYSHEETVTLFTLSKCLTIVN